MATSQTNVFDQFDSHGQNVFDQFDTKKPEDVSAVADVAKSALTGARKGILSIPAIPGDLADLLGFIERKVVEKSGGNWDEYIKHPINSIPNEILSYLPSSEDIQKFVTERGSTFHDPQTTAGKYTQSITQGATGNLVPGGSAKSLMTMGGAGGASGELASDLTEGNPLARFIGTLLGVTAAGGGRALSKNSGEMIKEATEGLTPEQIQAAKAMQASGRATGVDLMGPEVLPQGPIQQLASDTMASKTGGKVISDFLEKRPEQIKKAVGTQLNKIGVKETPADTVSRAQESATNIISDAEKARTAASSPYYKAAEGYSISTDQQVPIYAAIDESIAKTGSAEIKNKVLSLQNDINSAEGNVGKLNDVVKVWRNKIDNPSINADPLDKQAAKFISPILKNIENQTAKSAPELAQGKRVHQRRTEMSVDPLVKGDIGKIAGAGFDPQTTPPISRVLSTLTDEKTARPVTIRQTYKELNQKDAKAFPQMVRLHLENAFDEASKDVQAGTNRMLGANFKKSVYGTPQQRENFLEMMAGVAEANGVNKEGLRRGAVTLLEVLERTGKVPNIGSQTAGRLASDQMAKGSRVAGTLETVSAQPLGSIAKVLRDVASRKAYKELAEVFTDPNSVEKMIELSKLTPSNKKAELLVAEILAVIRSTNDSANDTSEE